MILVEYRICDEDKLLTCVYENIIMYKIIIYCNSVMSYTRSI